MDTVWLLLRVLLMTALVAGLAYLTSSLLRRRAVRLQRGSCLEVIDAVALGGRHHLVLVRAGSRVLCIGVSVDGLRRIAEFEGAAAEELLAMARDGGDARPGEDLAELARRFRRILRRKLGDPEERGDR